METRLYRSLPEHLGPAVQPPDTDESGQLEVAVVCLERSEDPDANNHTGYDYWGAYSDDSNLLDEWEQKNTNSLTRIEYSALPAPVTFYPYPFSNTNLSPVRARDDKGRFIPDDLSTPDVNEAWTLINN